MKRQFRLDRFFLMLIVPAIVGAIYGIGYALTFIPLDILNALDDNRFASAGINIFLIFIALVTIYVPVILAVWPLLNWLFPEKKNDKI